MEQKRNTLNEDSADIRFFFYFGIVQNPSRYYPTIISGMLSFYFVPVFYQLSKRKYICRRIFTVLFKIRIENCNVFSLSLPT